MIRVLGWHFVAAIRHVCLVIALAALPFSTLAAPLTLEATGAVTGFFTGDPNAPRSISYFPNVIIAPGTPFTIRATYDPAVATDTDPDPLVGQYPAALTGMSVTFGGHTHTFTDSSLRQFGVFSSGEFGISWVSAPISHPSGATETAGAHLSIAAGPEGSTSLPTVAPDITQARRKQMLFVVNVQHQGGGSSEIIVGDVTNLSISGAAPSKRPVVILPGIMGTELRRIDNNDAVWVNRLRLVNEFYDHSLFALHLEADGATTDANHRCVITRHKCTVDSDCGTGPGSCVRGGAALEARNPLDLPPVVVPGVGEFFGYQAYRSLGEFLQKEGGYTPDTDLFSFPYDWRFDLRVQAERFHEALTREFGSRKIDIVAHSLGGLLIRAYLQRYPDEDRIASVIYLGTPHSGAPLAYAWLTGAASAVKNFNGEFPYLRLDTETFLVRNFPTAYSLLPRFDFIFRNTGGGLSLEPLQDSFARLGDRPLLASANALHETGLAGPNRVSRSFAINGTKRRTLLALDYTDPSRLIGLSDPSGDGTVPFVSSSGFLPGANLYVIEDHKDLPGNSIVQQQILNILRGQEHTHAPGILTSPIADEDAIGWFSGSPIRTQIRDDANKMNGLDADGNLHQGIAGSSHFVFPENEGGFLPFGKEYTISVAATDDGVFSLVFNHLVPPDDAIAHSTAYIDIPISGRSRGELSLSPTDTAPNLQLDVNGDGVTDFVVPANAAPTADLFPAVLTNMVENLALSEGMRQSLLAKLSAAATAIALGNVNAAGGQLSAFLEEVRAQRGKALTVADADKLIAMGNRALSAL
jgi:pimeloyl-ACP methyl ester carboxylesterase